MPFIEKQKHVVARRAVASSLDTLKRMSLEQSIDKFDGSPSRAGADSARRPASQATTARAAASPSRTNLRGAPTGLNSLEDELVAVMPDHQDGVFFVDVSSPRQQSPAQSLQVLPSAAPPPVSTSTSPRQQAPANSSSASPRTSSPMQALRRKPSFLVSARTELDKIKEQREAASKAAAKSKSNLASLEHVSKLLDGTVGIQQRAASKKSVEALEKGDIQIGYKLNSLGSLVLKDSVAASFYCDFKLFAWWYDPALKDCNPKDEDWKYKAKYNPDLQICNESELRVYYHEDKLLEDGRVKWTRYYRGTLFTREVLLHFFPFDFQNLPICIRPHKYDITKAELAVRQECHILDHWDKHEWEVIGHRHETYATNRLASTTGKVYSELHLVLMVRRFYGWYIVNIAVFMSAQVMMSWSVFVMEPIDTGSRMETALGLVLSAISTKFVIASELPKISYQTLADRFITVCFGFLVLVTVVNVVVGITARDHFDLTRYWSRSSEYPNNGEASLALALLVDKLCALGCVSTWVIWCTTIWLELRQHNKAYRKWRDRRLPLSCCPEIYLLSLNGSSTGLAAARAKFVPSADKVMSPRPRLLRQLSSITMRGKSPDPAC
jgi:hypothetical protein